MLKQDDPPSPAKRPIVHAARPDAEHFEFTDEPPTPNDKEKTKSFQQQKGMGLYQDTILENSRATFRQPNVNR